VPVILFSHNLPTDRTRELIKPSKDAERLLFLVLKKLGSFRFEIFCGRRHNSGRFRRFWLKSSGPGPQLQAAIFVPLKKIGKNPHL